MTILFICLAVGSGFVAGFYCAKSPRIPFLRRRREYSIGIYTGTTPLALSASSLAANPVLTARDVTDVSADFVADPFMVKDGRSWYMFFEVMNKNTSKGEIGLARSHDGLHWVYDRIVLDEPFHLSYPYVFAWNGDYYMLPESCEAYSLRLYKAAAFPHRWDYVKTLLRGNYFDASLVFHGERWWLFAPDRNDILHLFHADQLMGEWTEHRQSPIVFRDKRIARPGGRILQSGNKLYRIAQDCERQYGYRLHAFEITQLTTDVYQEQEVPTNPIVRPTGRGWNGEKMHHLDAHEMGLNDWVACVDGVGRSWTVRSRRSG